MKKIERVGLTDTEVLESRKIHGENVLTPPPKTPAWLLFLLKFKDPIITILLVALGISLVIAVYHGDFMECIGIAVAILLAVFFGFWMEYSADLIFEKMKRVDDYELTKVIRNGVTVTVPKNELVVGDLVILSAGDEIPADIELLEDTSMKVSESTMTGESMPVKKVSKKGNWSQSGYPPYLCLMSTKVTEGNGLGVVTSVGDKTEIGKTTRTAQEEVNIETPLNKQLDSLASVISKTAFILAGLLFTFLNLGYFFLGNPTDLSWLVILEVEISFLMAAVTLIVVAVPEGLPLASTLALAFSMKTMAKENNLVKKMHATETIGAVNVIFTDKTGTLTQNKMTIVGLDEVDSKNLLTNMAINSTAELAPNGDVIGNPTEGAMMMHLATKGIDYNTSRRSTNIITQKPFDSMTKYMSTIIKKGKSTLMYVKGAPEVISRMIGDDSFMEVVKSNQKKGRRVISFACGETESSLVYSGSCFIEDPIRSDVPGAIENCYVAGVDVVMVTGDNITTATEIARQAGFSNIWAIEAKDFFTEIQKADIMGRPFPNVIARCKPENKLEILKWAQERGYICIMTGDGVNDSPSLNYANVGIAMGSGTSAAKEAAEVILLDDAFPSIVTGMKWGRSLYKNIQAFLVFQLIINLTTCLVVLAGPILGIDMPFTVTQMLWVNIVMDTLAALCLASEPADSRVLNEKPRNVNSFIINKSMWRTILGFGLTLATVLGTIVYDIAQGSIWFGMDLTMLFALFMTVCWYNLFNIRVFQKKKSIFTDINKSGKFLLGALFILIGTICIIQFGGEVFNTRPMNLNEWLVVMGLGSFVVIIKEGYYQLTR